jgi:YHS domain-containing protein
MKLGSAVMVGLTLAAMPLIVVAAQDAKDKPALPETVACAVMPDHIVNVKDAMAKGMFADYEYNRYFFCCAGCPPQFAKSPEKFAKNASIPLQSIPMPEKIACAVMEDHSINPKQATEKKLFADYNGRRYFFCCEGCVPAFNKEPEKFAKRASVPIGQIELPKTVACAVMTDNKVDVKDALNKGMFADYKGRRYLFCCAGCPGAFKADPAKFANNASIPSPKVEKKETKETK